MKILATILISLAFFSARSQTFYVHETTGNLETILKSALNQKGDSTVELELKADYVVKWLIEFRGAVARSTVSAVLVSGATGRVLYSTVPEKVISNLGLPTMNGLKHGVEHVAETNLGDIISAARADFASRK